jgi:hypothetical protein
MVRTGVVAKSTPPGELRIDCTPSSATLFAFDSSPRQKVTVAKEINGRDSARHSGGYAGEELLIT